MLKLTIVFIMVILFLVNLPFFPEKTGQAIAFENFQHTLLNTNDSVTLFSTLKQYLRTEDQWEKIEPLLKVLMKEKSYLNTDKLPNPTTLLDELRHSCRGPYLEGKTADYLIPLIYSMTADTHPDGLHDMLRLYFTRITKQRGIKLSLVADNLLFLNVNLNSKKGSHSVLYTFVDYSSIDVIKLLWSKGARPRSDEDLIACAADGASWNTVSFFLDKGVRVSNRVDASRPLQAVHYAAYRGGGSAEVMKKLFEHEATLDIKSFDKGATPLYYAVQANNKDVIAFLLGTGGDPFISSVQDGSILLQARSVDTFKLLWQRGLRPGKGEFHNKDWYDKTLYQQVCEFLKDQGVDPDQL